MHFFSLHICYKYLIHPRFLDFTAVTVEWTVIASLCIILVHAKHFIPPHDKYFQKLVFQRLQYMLFPLVGLCFMHSSVNLSCDTVSTFWSPLFCRAGGILIFFLAVQ